MKTILLFLFPVLVFAQEPKTINQVVTTPLEIISGKAGEPRDWDAFRNLFVPGARIHRISMMPSAPLRTMTVDQFIEGTAKALEKDDFKEESMHMEIDSFQHIAHVWQSYKLTTPDTSIEGINTYELVFIFGRWQITSLTWEPLQRGGIMAYKIIPYSPFSWLEGTWTRPLKLGMGFERWRLLPDGSLEGEGGVTEDGHTEIFEKLWIKRFGDHWVYMAAPGNNAPTLFTYQGTVNDLIIFKNEEHDFPNTIVYQKNRDGSMTASISGKQDGKEKAVKFEFKRKVN
jgi:hypothetical protein